MKHINSLITSFVILLSFYSCLGEDMEPCPIESAVRLEFSYTKNWETSDYFPQEVDSLLVVLYEENDQYRMHYRIARETLDQGYILPFNKQMPDGNYSIVVWGKDKTRDFTAHDYAKSKYDMRIDLISSTGQVSPEIGNLFHGMTQLNVKQGSGSSIVKMTKNTSQLSVYIIDEMTTAAAPIAIDDYTVEITAPNGSYKYDNSLAATQLRLNYIQKYSVLTYDTLLATCKMLRLYPEDDSLIRFKDAEGNVIPVINSENRMISTPVSLTGEILRSPDINNQEDLDEQDSFALFYRIGRNDTGDQLTIRLTGVDYWTVGGGEPGI